MRSEPASFRKWALTMAAIMAAAICAFALLYALDFYLTGGGTTETHDPISRYVFFDPDHITDAVPALGGMIAAVLGIVITVVSIVVQLSANRYHGVATMFLRDRINITVMGFYIVACVSGVLVSLSVRANFVPRATVLGMMVATTLGLVLMAPYFAYVFWFLEPSNIIARIRSDALARAQQGAGTSSVTLCVDNQARVVGAMEELTDISSNSISGKDKIIASAAVDALKDFAVDYVSLKPTATDEWYKLGEHIQTNPDFVAMEPESRDDLVVRRTWVEWKVMRQYLGIYNDALALMPDINYLIAIDTRYIGEAAAAANDDELIELVFRFMNSYLRSTLNGRNVRTAYNVLNQYRQLVEAMMSSGHGTAAAAAARHMKYYGHVSYDMNLPFVTETVAYDMGTLCEVAHALKLDEQDQILDLFLQLDRETARRSKERALKGVRKAQVKLAAYYLTQKERDKARIIFRDMEHDPPERLQAIQKELEQVQTKDFWEIIDRGRNFEFMPPKQKSAMRRFFRWFDGVETVRADASKADASKAGASKAAGDKATKAAQRKAATVQDEPEANRKTKSGGNKVSGT